MERLIHVIYAYFEKNLEYQHNLSFFLKHAYLPQIDFTIVINDRCSVEIPKKENITVITRENTGFDFQGYHAGVQSLLKRNLVQPKHYYLFINSTVRGHLYHHMCPNISIGIHLFLIC